MELIRGTGSEIVEAEVVDQYESKETGFAYGIALLDGERVPVVQYNWWEYWYCDAGEIVK